MLQMADSLKEEFLEDDFGQLNNSGNKNLLADEIEINSFEKPKRKKSNLLLMEDEELYEFDNDDLFTQLAENKQEQKVDLSYKCTYCN